MAEGAMTEGLTVTENLQCHEETDQSVVRGVGR